MSITLKRAQATVELCTDLALAAEHERASKRLHDARATKDDRENSSSAAIAREITDLESQMADATLVFTLAALPRKRYAEIVAEHPAREGDELDESFGLNVSTGIDAILTEPGVIVAVANKVTGEPVDFDAPAEWPDLADEMSNSQWEQFATSVIQLNQGKVGVPFSPVASALIRRSDASSSKPSA